MIKIGDIVRNSRGWQGKVIGFTQNGAFLVQYASRSQWERTGGLTLLRADAAETPDNTEQYCGEPLTRTGEQ